MKKALIALGLIAAAAGLVLAYVGMRKERDREAASESPVIAPSRVERGTDGEVILRLDSETQERLGLQTALPRAGSIAAEIVASARVLDGAALAAAVNEIRSAESARDLARSDDARKKKLFDNGLNVSARAVEQAEAAAKQEQLALEAMRAGLAAAWGQVLAKRDDLQAFASLLLLREAALVRVELQPMDKLKEPPRTVRLFWRNGEALAEAQVLERAPSLDSTLAGQGFLCLVTHNANQLIPGAVLVARLQTGATEKGLVLPRGAVIRHAGLGWAYVQTAPDTFARRSVPLDQAHPDGWLVRGQWRQPIVVMGAQSLLSEELKGNIQMKE